MQIMQDLAKNKKWITYGIFFIVIPAVTALGIFVFKDRKYAFITLVITVLSCIPLMMTFEKRVNNTRKLIIIAVMTALSVVGRFLFALVPGFKPVTAIVVLTAVFFGGEAGFLTGALSAVLSNFMFGQGPWTPFQMLAWGMIGLLAGLLSKRLRKSRILLAVYGIFAGVAFSMIMDIWTVVWYDNSFQPALYIAALISSLPYTLMYAVSNVVFLLAMIGPIGKKLERIRTKYGLQ